MSLTFSWILVNELAIGSIIRDSNDINYLKEKGIKSILSLTNYDDIIFEEKIRIKFNYKKIILPDHRSKDELRIDEIIKAIKIIEKIIIDSPLFIHCEASIERSPIIAIAWLINTKNLSLEEGLDYLVSVHKKTNPLSHQINALIDFSNFLKK